MSTSIESSIEQYKINEEYEDDHGNTHRLRVVLEYDRAKNTFAVLPNGRHKNFSFHHGHSDKSYMWLALSRAIGKAAQIGRFLQQGERIEDLLEKNENNEGPEMLEEESPSEEPEKEEEDVPTDTSGTESS